MKILFLIDALGSGGAQKQMIVLARNIRARGHDCALVVYHPEPSFFRSQLEACGLEVKVIEKRLTGRLGLIRRLATVIRLENYQCAIAFLDGPCFYLELTRLFGVTIPLICSERSSRHNDPSRLNSLVKRLLHALATRVVANSYSHGDWLRSRFSWLRNRVDVIWNGIEISSLNNSSFASLECELRLVGVGRIGWEKNIVVLIKALSKFYRKRGWVPVVSWIGRWSESAGRDQENRELLLKLLVQYPEVGERWSWMGEVEDVSELLRQHDYLVLPSHYEGLPNVVCESLASGIPVIASDVCDNGRLVADGLSGFLFDANDVDSLLGVLLEASALSIEGRMAQGANARFFAERNLREDRMVSKYESLMKSLVSSCNSSA